MPDDQKGSYSGTDSYRYVEPLIRKRSKTLKVICPYISESYARLLVKESSRKTVSVVTSNSRISTGAVKILDKGGGRFPYLTLSAYFIILGIAFYLLHLYLAELVVIPIIVLVVGITVVHYSVPRKRRVNVRIASENFVHEKIFLSDNVAIVGSANLTYAGLHKNVEHIEVIRSQEKLVALDRHFNELWDSIAT